MLPNCKTRVGVQGCESDAYSRVDFRIGVRPRVSVASEVLGVVYRPARVPIRWWAGSRFLASAPLAIVTVIDQW